MAKQIPEDAKRSYAQFIITNDGQQSLIEQVMAIHAELLKFSVNPS